MHLEFGIKQVVKSLDLKEWDWERDYLEVHFYLIHNVLLRLDCGFVMFFLRLDCDKVIYLVYKIFVSLLETSFANDQASDGCQYSLTLSIWRQRGNIGVL